MKPLNFLLFIPFFVSFIFGEAGSRIVDEDADPPAFCHRNDTIYVIDNYSVIVDLIHTEFTPSELEEKLPDFKAMEGWPSKGFPCAYDRDWQLLWNETDSLLCVDFCSVQETGEKTLHWCLDQFSIKSEGTTMGAFTIGKEFPFSMISSYMTDDINVEELECVMLFNSFGKLDIALQNGIIRRMILCRVYPEERVFTFNWGKVFLEELGPSRIDWFDFLPLFAPDRNSTFYKQLKAVGIYKL